MLWNCFFQQKYYSRKKNPNQKHQNPQQKQPPPPSSQPNSAFLCCWSNPFAALLLSSVTSLTHGRLNWQKWTQILMLQHSCQSHSIDIDSFLSLFHELLKKDRGQGKNKGILEIICDKALLCQGQKRGKSSWSLKMLTKNFYIRSHSDDSEK